MEMYFCFSFGLSAISVLENIKSSPMFLGHVYVCTPKYLYIFINIYIFIYKNIYIILQHIYIYIYIFQTELSEAVVSFMIASYTCTGCAFFPLVPF